MRRGLDLKGPRGNRSAQSFLLSLGDTLRPLSDPVELEDQACRLLADHLGVDRAHYAEIDEPGGRISVQRDVVRPGVVSIAGTHAVADFAWAFANFRVGRCNVVEDTQNSPLVPASEREACAALQAVALIAAPVIADGNLVGSLVVTESKPRRWSAGDVRLVQGVADRLWATLRRARAEAALRVRTEALERQAAQLRRLASELTLTEHRTRQLLSRTLHDGLQQQLFCVAMTLDTEIQEGGSGNQRLKRAREELQEAMGLTRSLSVDLFPPVLHNDGLPEALDWLVTWARRSYDLTVEVSADQGADPSALDTRILLFESVRELIFNAVKHARVQELRVTLTQVPPDHVQVVVADQGVGFDPEQVLHSASSEPGLGLFSIRERITLLGGEMQVDSAPGKGSRFTIRAPRQARAGTGPGGVASRPDGNDEFMALLPFSPSPSTDLKCRLRILLVDDHALVREGLRELLSRHPELEVVGESVNGRDAIEKAHALQPDVVVMDVADLPRVFQTN